MVIFKVWSNNRSKKIFVNLKEGDTVNNLCKRLILKGNYLLYYLF